MLLSKARWPDVLSLRRESKATSRRLSMGSQGCWSPARIRRHWLRPLLDCRTTQCCSIDLRDRDAPLRSSSSRLTAIDGASNRSWRMSDALDHLPLPFVAPLRLTLRDNELSRSHHADQSGG